MSGHGWRFSLITGVLIHSLFVQKHHNFLLNLILNSLERTKKPIAITLTRPSLPSSHVQATRKGFELQKISFVALKTFTEKKFELSRSRKLFCMSLGEEEGSDCARYMEYTRENAFHATMKEDVASSYSRHGQTSDRRTSLITQANNWRLWKLVWQRVLAEIGARVIAKMPNLDMRKESGLARGKVADCQRWANVG